jgi:uncharacterized protein
MQEKTSKQLASQVFKAQKVKTPEAMNTLAATVITLVKTPLVAPILVISAFLMATAAFLFLSGDPNAGSPSVRVSLAKLGAPSNAPPSVDAGSGAAAFSLDSLGLFQDQSVGATDDNVAALITLPGDISQLTSIRKPATPQTATPLPLAPLAGLTQSSVDGPLPVISAKGLAPALAYSRPFISDGRPKVALIVGGLGINPVTTRAAIEQLPAQVTLSFVPYADGLQAWIDMARAQGHEVMLEVPMQPVNYPENDPGPQTLMARAKPEDLKSRINWVMSRAVGYFALTNYQGSAFLQDKAGVASFMAALKARGLGFIDDGQARAIEGAYMRASADKIIDNQITQAAILSQLQGLEAMARTRGQALGSGFAYPVTLATALKWTQGLEQKGLQLAPASAISHR